jgi:hypothetical protein
MTSTHAVEEFNPDEDETNCSNCAPELVSTESFKKSTPPLIIEVFYIGSPIDQSKLLVIKSDCKGDGQYKVIYEKQDCDFSHFTSKASKFTFTNFYYNPLNGKCDRKATVEKIDTKKYCKKPKTIR